jgi:hypothetical protein
MGGGVPCGKQRKHKKHRPRSNDVIKRLVHHRKHNDDHVLCSVPEWARRLGKHKPNVDSGRDRHPQNSNEHGPAPSQHRTFAVLPDLSKWRDIVTVTMIVIVIVVVIVTVIAIVIVIVIVIDGKTLIIVAIAILSCWQL